MTSSLYEVLLVCILIATLQVFEVMLVKFNFGGVSTIGKYVSYTVYLFIYLFYLCIVFVPLSSDSHLKESRYPPFFPGPLVYLSSYS
jgi:hypothetical protein